MTYGLKVSPVGFDVKTAAAKDLVITSDLSSPKISSILTDQFVKSGNPGETFEIVHGLGFTPAYFFYLKVSDRWWGDLGEDPTTTLRWVIVFSPLSPVY